MEINTGLADPKMTLRIAEMSSVPLPLTPAEFGNFVVEETEKWGTVIRAAKIKLTGG
jgi:tripartite-type tricarboxylate transporter receptor subunit TctC